MKRRKNKTKAETKNENSASIQDCVFNSPAEVSFAANDTENETQTFEMVVYNGEILLGHPIWGNFAVDLKGLKFAKNPLPVLEEHFSGKRVGFTTKQEIKDKVTVEGQFVKNQGAIELQADMKAGFPMEASMYVPPTVVERISEGESVEVNGFTLEGPGTVFRKAIIREVSMCPMGAFSNTSAIALSANDSQKVKFSIINEENFQMKDMTIETFAEDHSDLYQQIQEKSKADGEKAERDLFSELEKVCAGDSELLITCFKEGKTAAEASQMRSEKLVKENAELKAKVTEFQTTKVETTETKTKVDPATTEFSDDSKKEVTTKPDSEEALKSQFSDSAELQDEFKTEAAYLAFKKAEKAGYVKILKK